MRYIHTIVRSALQTAYEWDLTPRNVADRAKPPKPKARGDRHEQINTWPHGTLRAFLHQTDGERLHPLWLLLATTGLRRGEAISLTWQALDVELGALSVRRSLVDVDCGRPVWSDPKTIRGRRVIALDSTTGQALRHVKTHSDADRQRAGSSYEDHGLVFTHQDGSPLHPDTTSKNFTRRGEQLGLPRIRLHDLRHTWATLALESGIRSTSKSSKNASATPTSPSPWTSTATSHPPCSSTPPNASPTSSSPRPPHSQERRLNSRIPHLALATHQTPHRSCDHSVTTRP